MNMHFNISTYMIAYFWIRRIDSSLGSANNFGAMHAQGKLSYVWTT